MPYFTEKHLAELASAYHDVHSTFRVLRDRYLSRPWISADAREFAMHGFGRRLGTLIRNIENVWSSLPPELEQIPNRDCVVDATSNLHAFIANVFGCLDNLAWVWVYERGVKNADGSSLNPLAVGLGKKSAKVRASFSDEFNEYLDSLENWIKYIKGFRDSLAHRIPVYIPPFVVHPDRLEEYERLEREMARAFRALDFAEYDRLDAAQKKLGAFRPWMAQSLAEMPPVSFHPQMIADFRSVEEIASKMLDEFDKPPIDESYRHE
jgi:hypothetical protein